MSIVPKETLQVIAQSIGIPNLSPQVADALAPDVEYRVREIMQEAIKCMRHSKRTILTADDVDSALKLRNVEPLYGFASNDPLRLKRAAGYKDLFYVDDKNLEFKDVMETPLPRAPLDTGVYTHWLAVEGVQPIIPENPSLEALAAQPDSKKSDCKEDVLPVDVKLPAKHVLSRELQLYFDKVIELTMRRPDSILFKKALLSLASDPGLHPLVPYFTYFIADEVSKNLNNFTSLFALMRIVWSLLQNRHVHIEPYLHQMMPSVITCLVAKKLGNRLSDNHWELRNFSANLVATICRRFGHVYHNLQSRVTRTLLHALLDPTKAPPQHYGAIQGLAALGSRVVRLLILPNLKPFMQLLEPEMLLEKQKNELKRQEAWRVYGALLFACGQCLHDQLKKLPHLHFPSGKICLRSKHKVAMTHPNKRKSSMNNLAQQQQPPLKKLATDSGPVGMAAMNSSYSVNMATIGQQQQQGQQGHGESWPGRGGESMAADGQAQKSSAVLAQAWKDIDARRLLSTLFEQFGQDMFPFIPTPELSLFL